MSQASQVLQHLQSGRPITSLEAIRRYGIIQLPRRIFDLRRDGHEVVSRPKTVTNRHGEKTRVSEYWLEGV
jgi:hypothetical protein